MGVNGFNNVSIDGIKIDLSGSDFSCSCGKIVVGGMELELDIACAVDFKAWLWGLYDKNILN